MKFILILALITIYAFQLIECESYSPYSSVVLEEMLRKNNGQNLTPKDLKLFKDLYNRLSAPSRRHCLNMFDEGCSNVGLFSAVSDENWLKNNSPGKR